MSQPQVVNLPAPATAAAEAPARSPAGVAAGPGLNAFVPVLICALALLGGFVAQVIVLLGERDALQAAHAAQQQTVDSAGKLRASLDALAADTQRMADAGNPNAALLVTELRKRGITINVQAGAAAAAAPPVATPAAR